MTDEKRFEHKGRAIRADIRTSATPQQAWEAWADPEKISGWFVDRASGEGTTGGTMTWFFDSFGYVLPYKVVESIPGQLFVLKWEPRQGNVGILEIQIAREGGETVVRLINSGFREDAQWDEEYEGTVSGWRMALALLKEYLENYFGRGKKTLLIIRPAAFTYQQLREYFVDSSKLAQWLSTSGSIGEAGDPCKLALREVGMLTGRVLAVTGWEVALSWKEIGGTLELKGFAMGPQRLLGVRVMSWALDEAGAKQLEGQLGPSVERLASLFPATAAAAGAGAEQRKESFEKKPWTSPKPSGTTS
jgi:uncharacterized protein YndB with AHSA1/START domain